MNPLYPVCMAIVGTMSAVVATAAVDAYPKAQKCTRNYTTMYKTYVKDITEHQAQIEAYEQWYSYCKLNFDRGGCSTDAYGRTKCF